MSGYHIREIQRGELGEASKIAEEHIDGDDMTDGHAMIVQPRSDLEIERSIKNQTQG